MSKSDSRLTHLFVSRGLLDWSAGVTASVAIFQASELISATIENRIYLAIAVGMTILFVMRRFRVNTSINASIARLSLPLSDALDSMTEGILVVDRDQRILLINRSLSNSMGVKTSSIIGTRVTALDWQHEEHDKDKPLPWDAAFGSGQGKDAKVQSGTVLGLAKPGGPTRKYLINASIVPTSSGDESVALVTLSDVTDLETRRGELVGMLKELESSRDEVRRQNGELQQLAIRDPLTGCTNRRGFFESFDGLWKRAERQDEELACMMVDIDHFKSINDNHGHSKGDEVLVGVAELLRKTFRDTDLICRYGGEEFCVVLPEQSLQHALNAGERFRNALETADFDGLNVTASLGVATRDQSHSSYELMIDQADQALYVAKRSGRNRVLSWLEVQDSPDAQDHERVSHRKRDEEEDYASSNQPSHDGAAGDGRSSDEHDEIPMQAVSALVSALAFRDPVTAEHSSRVASLCVSIGHGLMADRDLRVLETAALLHDIGKIGVPDSILLKPSRLNDSEWEVMRRQERMGVEIVRSAFASKQLANILKTHCAFFGEEESKPGMPSGNEIPLAARIISVCNAFDSMTTDRVYREGMTHEQAFEELRKCAGNQFDPLIVEQLIEYVSQTSHQQLANETTRRYQTSLQVGQQIEQIADAMQEFDLEGLHAISRRLTETANYLGADSISQSANQLAMAIDESKNIEEIVRLTQSLLQNYHESHHEMLLTTAAD